MTLANKERDQKSRSRTVIWSKSVNLSSFSKRCKSFCKCANQLQLHRTTLWFMGSCIKTWTFPLLLGHSWRGNGLNYLFFLPWDQNLQGIRSFLLLCIQSTKGLPSLWSLQETALDVEVRYPIPLKIMSFDGFEFWLIWPDLTPLTLRLHNFSTVSTLSKRMTHSECS